MKSIWYCSSVQGDKFEDNRRCCFENYFDVDDLNYISNAEIEVAIKHIYFDQENIEEKNWSKAVIYSKKRINGDEVLSIRSNICAESIVNTGYEKELCRFKIGQRNDFEFINPTFYKTNKGLLANAKFSIIDLKTQEFPTWEFGSPTYIHAIVREKMSDSFSIYLDSNDKKSVNQAYNTNTEFTIDLPERLRLEKWEVCLKSIILPCRIWNIYDEYEIQWIVNQANGMTIVSNTHEVVEGSYGIEDITHLIAQTLKGIKIVYDEKLNRVKIVKNGRLRATDTQSISFSPYLAKILGFTKEVKKENFSVLMYSNFTTTTRYPPNINFLSPKTIIVNSDIVEDTIFGGERVKLLKVIPNKMERIGDVIQYEFIQDEFVSLGTSEFNRIKISICDVSGQNLRVDYKEIPTRVQLEFRKGPKSI